MNDSLFNLLHSGRLRVWILAATLLCSARGVAGDWPTYRADPERTGFTAEALPSNLSLLWTHRETVPPEPAWPRSQRVTFDRAFEPVLAAGAVFFGGRDGRVTALDAGSGERRWVHYTEAPIRVAPVAWNNRVYVGGDDGVMVCLDAHTGTVLWRKRAGPDSQRVLGNGHLISRWPIRGGSVLRDGILYFTAGLWPSDGIFLHALDARSGKSVWLNDTAGGIYMPQPHGGAFAESGVSPQGHLLATESQVFVTNGRAVPAAFDRKTGVFQYFHLQSNGQRGGSFAMASDRFLLNSGVAFDQENGASAGSIGKGPLAAGADGALVRSTADALIGCEWRNQTRKNSDGSESVIRGLVGTVKIDQDSPGVAMIVAANRAIIGDVDTVRAADLTTGQIEWSAPVSGTAYGLAAADGRLVVSTDRGVIHCFGDPTNPVNQARSGAPNNDLPSTREAAVRGDGVPGQAADAILARSGVTDGYAVDLGCGDGRLARELALRSDLTIYGVESDPELVAKARRSLTAAGLYGSRVTILLADPAASTLPPYMANLVVSSRSIGLGPNGGDGTGESAVPEEEARRILRPYGGILCLGPLDAMTTTERGPLEGAGNWNHQYASPANTACSDDLLVRGPLGVLWFNDPGQRMVQRHGRGPSPLFHNGILYSEGRDDLIAVDAYNGRMLWSYPLPGILAAYDGDHLMGTSGSGSNYCVSDDAVFVRRDDQCFRIDAKSGELLNTFSAPPAVDGKPATWGYIAHENGVLYGSIANPEHVVTYRYVPGGDMGEQLTESRTLFAMDAASGEVLWRYDAKHSIRHNAIALANGYVTLIDRPLTLYDRERAGKPEGETHGELVCIQGGTGDVLWRNDEEIYGTLLAISPANQSLLMGYQPTRFRLASELGGRMTVFDLASGERQWDLNTDYQSRPMINDRTIYAQGGAWDLATGEPRPFNFDRSYGCGILAGSRELMVFRSATLGYFDLTQNSVTENFGGMRPGCWVNIIPAGGLVFAPEGSEGCQCSYQNQSWVALQPDGVRAPRVEPIGAASKEPVQVALTADDPARQSIRYTLDGSSPDESSRVYRNPIQLASSATLRARVYDETGRASRVTTAHYTVDPDLLSIDASLWKSWDAPGAAPAASRWIFDSTAIRQTSNIYVNTPETVSPRPDVERPGTFLVRQTPLPEGPGELEFEIKSDDDDGIGIAFAMSDPDHYLLWAAHRERPFRALTLKSGAGDGQYRLLASRDQGYTSGVWHRVRITHDRERVSIYFDDLTHPDLTAEIPPAQRDTLGNTIALYSWGNSGVAFRNLVWRERNGK